MELLLKVIIIIFIVIVIASFFSNLILFFTKSFEHTITIKDKSILSNRSNSTYRIVDTNNNIYNVVNVWFIGDFNRSEDYYFVNIGQTYKVKGYGIRIDALGIYPSIYTITKV